MGYNKIISYGDTLELYEYEKDIFRLVGGARRNHAPTNDNVGVGTSGEDTLSDQRSEKKREKRTDNARRASVAFRRIVSSNLGGSSSLPTLVTLTYKDNFTDLSGAYRHLTAFIQSLRYRFGKAFAYILVPEFQKRGAVHFHALFWGLPKEVLLTERQNRTLSRLWGHGFIYIKPTDGNEKLAFYLSKYFTKAFLDPRLINQKSYVASRNIKRPVIQKGPFPVDYVLDEFGVTEPPIIDRKYNTKWLGEGRLRIFKLNHDKP